MYWIFRLDNENIVECQVLENSVQGKVGLVESKWTLQLLVLFHSKKEAAENIV